MENEMTGAAPGMTIRQYRVIERLGAGGMGVVFKAEDTRLGRTAALKFLPPELTREEASKQRFLVEARAAARLDHPNICTVYEAGETDDGQLFIAMAYYEGETLDRRIVRGAIPAAEAVALVRQIAEGLAAAHAAGIVHRDIKPTNVVVTASGVAKILDFGLAKLTDVSMTRSRTTVGTAAYMAPEQIRGDRVTPATDVWGLGVLFFELLTALRPFRSEHDQGVLYSILSDPAPPVRDHHPDIPLELEAVVQKMLSKEPEQRYQSMGELLAELSLPATAEPDSESATDLFERRFTPGSIVGGRYRIISLLGEGGMGEVYRADDLKLGQKVALKYIPRRLTDDAEAYRRICTEVRIGRQLSHPNICRIFDIVEAGGNRFIAMEFIDGEDLASLLRRIGRLPPDKALALTRDIAHGLAAAHDRGIVHRDLKPANIMVDGEGRARITDFGLSALAERLHAEREIAGTPAYMAPEQLSGGEVTARADLYALGLIAYEIFTGRQMFDGSSVEEIRNQHVSLRRRPSSLVREMDPAVERVILKCIEENPADRMPSVHAVIAALPGGDALTAAIKAGETPSPGMVAAASVAGDLTPGRAWILFAGTAVLLVFSVWIGDKTMLHGLVSKIRSQDALEERAHTVTTAFGYAPSAYVRYVAYVRNDGYVHSISARQNGDWSLLRSTPPSAYRCIYRTSPRPFVPFNTHRSIRPDDPPENLPGMSTIHFDHEGRLVYFRRIPDSRTVPLLPGGSDWATAFAEADLDPARFKPAAPGWLPPYAFDERAAWTGSHAKNPQLPLRVEAASAHGRIVYFHVIEPWDKPAALPSTRWNANDIIAALSALTLLLLVFFARRNAVRRRADIRGAMHIGIFVALASFAGIVSAAIHSGRPQAEWMLFMSVTGVSLFFAAEVSVVYIAIEPYVRRQWPRMLVGWSRLVAGHLRDPLVGRDVLVGALIGSTVLIVRHLTYLSALRMHWKGTVPANVLSQASLDTASAFVWGLTDPAVAAVTWAIAWLGILVLLRLGLRNYRLSLLGLAVLITLPGVASATPLVAILAGAMAVLLVATLHRFGLLAMLTALFYRLAPLENPLTLDFTAWFAPRSTLFLLILLSIAAWGFYTSLGGKPVFGNLMYEEGEATA
jgi:serine/threonine-protein kinase